MCNDRSVKLQWVKKCRDNNIVVEMDKIHIYVLEGNVYVNTCTMYTQNYEEKKEVSCPTHINTNPWTYKH